MAGLTLRDAWTRIARAISQTHPLVILAIAWGFLIVYAFPGQMTQDSFDHLGEARQGIYSDGHPPAINLLWKVVEVVVAGPFGMLVVQSATFLAGLYLVLRKTFTPRRAACGAAGLLVFPPVMMPFAVIWKDCLMAGFLMLGLAGLLSKQRWARLAALVSLSAATAVRYNAFAATLPLVLLLFEWQPGLRSFKRLAIAFAAWLVLTCAAFGFNAAITDKPMHFWHSSLAIHDIVGTLAFLDEDISDDELRQTFAGSELVTPSNIHATARMLYTPRDFLPILNHPTKGMWALPIYGYVPAPQAMRDAIERAWWELVTTHPVAYVKHRLSVMAAVLSLTSSRPAATITKREFKYPEYARSLGLSTEWSPLQHELTNIEYLIWRHTPIFVPWIYLVLSLILLTVVRRHRDILGILTSGLLLESSLLVLAPSPDYRYSHWMVICASLAVVVLTARRMRTPSEAT